MTDLVGYNDIYTMITGKDAATGKKRSRLVGAAWTALNFVPVSKVAKLAKAAKVLATAKKAEKVAKNGGRIKRAARATKLATKRAAEKLAKRKPAKKTAKKAAEKARKAKKVKTAKKAKHQQAKPKKTSHGTKHKTTKKQQKRYNKKKAAGKARKASYARKKGGTKKKPGKRKGAKAKTAKRRAKNRVKKDHKAKKASGAKGFNIDEIHPKLKTEPDTAFFWSGRTDGVGGADIAADVAKSKGGVTLESTIGNKNIKMPEWDFNKPESMKAWDLASGSYAEQVSGEVRAVVGSELRKGNIWENVELPRLKNNPKVTKITTIDPKTGIEKIIFERK